jgi:hypothetical protein
MYRSRQFTLRRAQASAAVLLAMVTLMAERASAQACSPDPCLNGGTCLEPSPEAFVCQCPEAFIGTFCESEAPPIDPCVPNPCFNGGLCFTDEGGEGTACQCQPGFTGPTCETPLIVTFPNPCTVNPCLNGGVCNDIAGITFSCQCVSGFTGFICETAACPDADEDGCGECGESDVTNDGTDSDGDGACNTGDADDDGDGVND